MKVAILAPSPVPFFIGGAENLWKGLVDSLNERGEVEADLIKIPSAERTFEEVVSSYKAFSLLDVSHFDLVITTKYPAWMVRHPRHVLYLQHKLRGLYDTYPDSLSKEIPVEWSIPKCLRELLSSSSDSRDQLPLLFELLEDFVAKKLDYPPEWFELPGPIIRAVVHKLDAIGLAPGSIYSYNAISHTVATREKYFPKDQFVSVIHHPTSLKGLREGRFGSIFCASRLDGPKRIDLLIRAYLESGISRPLRIAGSGSEEHALRRLAGGNSNIHFLGRISQEQLIDEYANAAFIPFFPLQEDYGLVTLEAMQSGKAVLTTNDAGGVNELVADGKNGRVVAPSVDEISTAIRELSLDLVKTEKMGRAALESVRAIDWNKLLDALLGVKVGSVRGGQGERRNILVANTFSIFPPLSGGQHRLYHLYRHLASIHNITLVVLVPAENEIEELELAPGLREIRVPKSSALQEREAVLDQLTGISCGDLAAMFYPNDDIRWLYTLREQAANSDIVVAAHPYVYPALRAIWRGDIFYDAHNVEYDLKAPFLLGHPDLLNQLKEIEGECCRQAPVVFACSIQDSARLSNLYSLPTSSLKIVANGVDTELVRYVPHSQRKYLKAEIGVESDIFALFVGSAHPPNQMAAMSLLEMAWEMPHVNFMIIGSVGNHMPAKRPRNFYVLGTVSEAEKLQWFKLADIALNPITSGSGTNLKLLDYAASGIPVLTTLFGARGGVLESEDYWVSEVPDFPKNIDAILSLSEPERCNRIISARRRVQEFADWRVLVSALREGFEHYLCSRVSKNTSGVYI